MVILYLKKKHIELITNNNKLNLNEIIYIGDSINDFYAAKYYGIHFVKIGIERLNIQYDKIFFLDNLINLLKVIESI